MRLFYTRKPRSFQHTYIYADERKERLEQLKEKAKREMDLPDTRPYNPETIRGKFTTPRLEQRKAARQKPMRTATVLTLIALLSCLWYAISRGIA